MEQLCDSRCPSNSGILAGICKGKKWVYTEHDPMFAVTYSYAVGGCGIFGEIRNNEAIKLFLDQVFKELQQDGINEFEFSCEDKELTKQVLKLFPNKIIENEMEYSYRYEGACAKNENLPSLNEYQICRIDNQLLNDSASYKNKEILSARMQESWEDNDRFLALSLGFVAIKEKEIVGIIFGSGRYQNYIAIDIEVEQLHRRKGIAEALTRYFVEACREQKCIPHWDCVESNMASRKLAEKVGFEQFKVRPYYWFDL